MKTKLCSKCQNLKLFKEFYKDKRKKSRLYSRCKKCCYVTSKKYTQSLLGKAMLKRYYHSTKGIYNQLKTTAKRKQIDFKLNKKLFIRWYNKQIKICIYCKRLEFQVIKDYNGRHNRLTIDRKDNKKGYKLNNITLCCHKCNTIKGDVFTYKEMIKIGKILKNKRY